MKLFQFIFENVRPNKENWQEILQRYNKRPNTFITFVRYPILKFNPINVYDTPLGIYSYPMDIDKITSFASHNEYFIIFEPKNPSEILNLQKYSNSDFMVDYEKLKINYGNIVDYFPSMEEVKQNAFAKNPGGYIFYLTEKISSKLNQKRKKILEYNKFSKAEKEKYNSYDQAYRGSKRIEINSRSIWRKVFLELGYKGVFDNGEEIIEAEPYQAVFFDIKALNVLEIVEKDNKTLDSDLVKTYGKSYNTIEKDGTKRYYMNGKLHRLDGPAVEWANGLKDYWINGKQFSKEVFKKKTGKD